jgi:hypothetical protein
VISNFSGEPLFENRRQSLQKNNNTTNEMTSQDNFISCFTFLEQNHVHTWHVQETAKCKKTMPSRHLFRMTTDVLKKMIRRLNTVNSKIEAHDTILSQFHPPPILKP